MEDREIIARRIAMELNDGDVVNLGIGIPSDVANYIPQGVHVVIHCENGILGAGPAPAKGQEDPDLVNAGDGHITTLPGAAYIDAAMSFAIIRGGHLDATVLGALQVDGDGSIANWMIPGKLIPGMGGAMDLVGGAKKVFAATTHLDKFGKSKILKKCTLPLTGHKKVSYIVTDFAFIEVTPKGLLLREVAEGKTVDEVVKATDAPLIVSEKVKIGFFK